MAQVTVFTAERMKEIEDTTVVSGLVDVNGNLLLRTREGDEIDAGYVKGDPGDPGAPGDPGVDGVDGSDTLSAGTINLWVGDTAPANWLICDGSAVSRTQYSSLFAVIGVKYGGGDGVNTFNLPNLKGKTPVGLDSTQSEFNALAKIGGEKAHLLTTAEMPSHKHGLEYNGQTLIYVDSQGGDTSTGNRFRLAVGAPNSSYFQALTGNVGGGAAHNILQPYQVVNFIIKASNGDTPGDSQLTQRVSALEVSTNAALPAGVISAWGSDVLPANWLLCDGAAVSRATYASLFAAIGTKYGGGDGVNTFNLPNLKGRTPVGRDAAQTEFDVLGEAGGAKTHTLTTAEMPVHNHGVTDPSHSHRQVVTANSGGAVRVDYNSDAASTPYDQGAYTANSSTGISINNAGSGAAHNNLQPYQVVNFIIKATNGDTPSDSQLTQRVSVVETRFNNEVDTGWAEWSPLAASGFSVSTENGKIQCVFRRKNGRTILNVLILKAGWTGNIRIWNIPVGFRPELNLVHWFRGAFGVSTCEVKVQNINGDAFLSANAPAAMGGIVGTFEWPADE